VLPPVSEPLPERVAEAYEDWTITPADVAALAEARGRECLAGFCHARHPNFIPKKEKRNEPRDGQSHSTGSGSGASPTKSAPAPASAPKPAAKTTVKTTVKTTTKPAAKPNGAGAGKAPSTAAGRDGNASSPKLSGQDSEPRPYSHMKDHPSVGPGKSYTKSQKKKLLEENAARNGGTLRDDRTGEPLVKPQKHKKGVSPPSDEAHVDHVHPRSKGGPNSASNAEIRSRMNNLQKGSKTRP